MRPACWGRMTPIHYGPQASHQHTPATLYSTPLCFLQSGVGYKRGAETVNWWFGVGKLHFVKIERLFCIFFTGLKDCGMTWN